jgi:hypothetical protein
VAIFIVAGHGPAPLTAQTSEQTPWVYIPQMDWGSVNPPANTITLKFPPGLALPLTPGGTTTVLQYPIQVFLAGVLLNPMQYQLSGQALTVPATGGFYQVFYWYGANQVN